MNNKFSEILLIILLFAIILIGAYVNVKTPYATRSSYLINDGNLCNNLASYTKLTAVQQRELLNYIPKNDPKNLCAKSPSAINLGELTGCFADLNHDGVVDSADLPILLGAWGVNPGHPADFTGDGVVDSADLPILLGAWGPCDCPDCASQIPISSQNLIKNFLGSKEYSKFVDANPELELNKNIR